MSQRVPKANMLLVCFCTTALPLANGSSQLPPSLVVNNHVPERGTCRAQACAAAAGHSGQPRGVEQGTSTLPEVCTCGYISRAFCRGGFWQLVYSRSCHALWTKLHFSAVSVLTSVAFLQHTSPSTHSHRFPTVPGDSAAVPL
jgi:hypothetical protein